MSKLIEILKEFDPEREVIVDGDESGWYSLKGVNTYTNDEDGKHYTNIVSSKGQL